MPPREHSPTQVENWGIDKQDDAGFVPEEGTWVDMGHLFQTFHPHMTGCKCDVNSTFINQDVPPLPRTNAPSTDWMPYNDRVKFKTAEFLFKCNQMSAKQINTLLDLWAATLIKHNTIDATPLGDVPWKMFSYDVWYRDPLQIVHNMLVNPAFDRGIKYSLYHDYTSNNKQYWKYLMSGDWAWNQADLIAKNQETYGSTFVPLIIGSDKTVVSVATGQIEYRPLYLSIGNIHNSRSLAKIFESVKPFMETPDVMHFPDCHFRRTVYGLGPYIADYPEQVLLSGIVQNWCPRCLANSKDLDGVHTELLIEQLTYKQVWQEYSIIGDLVPFTNDYPRVDIHELLLPDLLHQIIKGTFKDHLVDWVENYLNITHGARCAAKIMDDIDRRYVSYCIFAGFQQWTGDDSKALMKVYLAAIEGHVPQDMVCTFGAFLDFCYIVQCKALTETDLVQIQDALDHFHKYQEIFKATGTVTTFSLPRQHSLCHYILLIRLFGAPNGLCSSITESKHIKAVKEPWHHSSRFKALGQMLLTNQHLDKLAAACMDFEARGMLHGSCLSEALQELQRYVCTLGVELNLLHFPLIIQEFIHDQQHLDNPNPPKYDPMTAQLFLGKLTIFNSAAALFYAPSNLSGTGGMHQEHIRATPSWHGGPRRNDCIFANVGTNLDSHMGGLAVARVLCFFSFSNRTSHYPCTIVHWYSHVLKGRNPDTGVYIVTPTTNDDDTPDVSIIHVDSIFHAAHLIPVYGSDFIPIISLHDSYDMFNSYYVNKYADHHSFEIA
ncbi:uncharacterized protein EDB93DRAFT_1239624 [Suillus bovinus]|uniref:uncharacterized protein n=1 Tax=Suillus bovinus TaxID=48563 RepID=UPI001B85C426|nr:uncharacterized protein EDB93DRAFT_1239624 [Suillus bovinus]KAG2154319.1 hypothetical protein EDB93DRAFT_1239624 [Suillus bovinus]